MIDNRAGDAVLHRSSYDRSAMKTGVVHVGVGAFHRAHQAVYFDALMEETGEPVWGITGVNLRPAQSADADRLNAQNGEYVLKSMPTEGRPDYRLVRSIRQVLDWSRRPEEAESAIVDRSVQVVTITVTESGYFLGKNGSIDMENLEVQAELGGGRPTTVYAFLKHSLKRRCAADCGPLTILCCDNIRSNGTMLESNLHAYLEAFGETELIAWIRNNVTFPSSMVDRITPRPVQSVSEEVVRLFGIENDVTIHSEAFVQWVIEDRFAGSRPELDMVGVQMVNDVHPYEAAKIRILNGGHVSTAYLGALLGHKTFDTALSEPELSLGFDEFAGNEAIPVLGRDFPIDLHAYARQVKQRFLNHNIADSIARIAMDGVSKFQIFIIPTVRDCYRDGIIPYRCLRGIASWYLLMCRIKAGTSDFEYVDPLWSMVEDHVGEEREESFARLTALWGDLPETSPRFVGDLLDAIGNLKQELSTTGRGS